jgi:polysaccharide pyruvyl transferase WcaK-like protein
VRCILICSAARLTIDGRVANVGDEALTEVFAAGLADRFPDTQVLATLNIRGNVDLPAGRVRVRPVRALVKAIRGSSLVVIGGGTLLQEETRPGPLEPVAGLLRYLFVVSVLCWLFRRPMAVAFVGAETVATRRGRLALRLICRRARLTIVRDEESADLVELISGGRPRVGADAMFLSNWAPNSSPPTGNRVAVSLQAGITADAIRALAEQLAEHASEVTLIAMDRDRGGDAAALAALEDALSGRVLCRTLPESSGWRDVYRTISDVDVCVGMRLHFVIFGALAGRRIYVLASSPKTRSFARAAGLPAADVRLHGQLQQSLIESARLADEAAIRAFRGRAAEALDLVGAVRCGG